MTPPVAEPRRAPGDLDRETWLVAGVVIVGVIMSILDTTIVTLRSTRCRATSARRSGRSSGVATGYLLSLAIVIPLAGWMSERFGSKQVWMASVLMCTAGSALCGQAPSAEALIAFRVLQGLGGGMIMPVGMTPTPTAELAVSATRD